MIQGCVIAESLATGAVFAPSNVRVDKITRLDMSGTAAASQPRVWTVIEFTADDEYADDIARRLAATLSADGGWYADFRIGDDHVVVYAHTVFRYRRGDEAGRAEAAGYGRLVGVPEHQLDWKD